MKMYLPVFMVAAMFGAMVPAVGATNEGMGGASTANLTDMPAVRSNPNNVNYAKYETRSTTRTYSNTTGTANSGDRYYSSQPTTSRSQMYRGYNGSTTTRTTTNNRSQTVRKTVKRKYYLAHPFFQPTEGKFGSITDLGFNKASYELSFTPNPSVLASMDDTSAKWSMDQIALKEDLSFGITDKLAVLLMGIYDSTKYKLDWSSAPDDKMDSNGFNIYGAGLQWRFTDNEKWIATLSGYYERQKDIANDFVLDLRAGYKVSKSTIYGIARGWLMLFDDGVYGVGMTGTDAHGDEGLLAIYYDEDAERTFFFEGGLGVFSVLDEDWTLNIEALVGSYDWHNQASIKGAFGWQPNDWFALNLYAKTSFYDSADGKSLDFYVAERDPVTHQYVWMVDTGTGLVAPAGKAKMDKYQEMSIGAQVIFYF